ncbi:putative carnitine operon oxidoreductase [Escherichia coli]|nr:putative carnitine operon oxidoreductase [Escherichia coli]
MSLGCSEWGLYLGRGIQKGMFSVLSEGNDSNLLIVFYVQIMPDDFVMQLHRF